jgi:hypothetical protein
MGRAKEVAMGLPVVVNVAAWAAVAAGVGFVAVRNADLSQRLEQAEAAVAASAARAEEAARERHESGAALAAAKAREAVALEEVRKDVKSLWAEVMRAPEAAGPEGKDAVAASAGFEAAVRDVLDRYVLERKFRDAVGKAAAPSIPKKPKFAQLAKALDLKPDQADRLEEDIRGIQTELYQVLQIPRADGVVPLEEIATAEQYPEGSPERTAPFLKLFKLKIPETEETYVERAITLVQGLKSRAPEYLAVEQMETLNSIDLDWFGIKFN